VAPVRGIGYPSAMRRLAPLFCVLALACGAEEPAPAPAPEDEGSAPAAEAEPAAAEAAAEAEPEAVPDPVIDLDGESRYGAIPLAPGFAPDPRQERGTAEGRIAASELAEDCPGFVGAEPLHAIEARGPFARLYLGVRGEAPLGLVLRSETGDTTCASIPEESELALLESHLAPGTYRLWITTAAADDSVPYVLALSEVGLDPDAIPAP